MNKYEKELQGLKSWDEVQFSEPIGRGYDKIYTAGHGYLCVPKEDIFYSIALKICEYGFRGDIACYLEEDCEIPEFKRQIA